MKPRSFKGEALLEGTCDRVVAQLRSEDTVMGEGTMWDDYKNHVDKGWSIIEEEFMRCVDEWIWAELEKIPDVILRGLWLYTEKGTELVIEVEVAFEYDTEIDEDLVEQAECNYRDDLVEWVRHRLNLRAERESQEDQERE